MQVGPYIIDFTTSGIIEPRPLLSSRIVAVIPFNLDKQFKYDEIVPKVNFDFFNFFIYQFNFIFLFLSNFYLILFSFRFPNFVPNGIKNINILVCGTIKKPSGEIANILCKYFLENNFIYLFFLN